MSSRNRAGVRVRKARITSACPQCGRLIIRGEPIVSVAGRPFVHRHHLAGHPAGPPQLRPL